MNIATITSKGQITLPKDMRKKLHLEVGEKIDFRVDKKTGTAILVPLNKRASAVFGILKRKQNRPVTVGAMNKALKDNFLKKAL